MQFGEQVLRAASRRGCRGRNRARVERRRHAAHGGHSPALVREMRDHEERLLVIRQATTNRNFNRMTIVLAIGIFAGIAMLAFAGWTVRRDTAGARARRTGAARGRGSLPHAGEQHFAARLDGGCDGLHLLVQRSLVRLFRHHVGRDGRLGLAKDPSPGPRRAGRGQDHPLFQERRDLGRHISPARPGWHLPLVPFARGSHSGRRAEPCCAGSARTRT